MNKRPPKLASNILLWFLREELAEEVLGDLEEKYDLMTDQGPPWLANINYWFQVSNYLRPFAIKNLHTHSIYPTMFRHYLLINWRNLVKNKGYSAINIGGLALGIAAVLFIMQYVSYERSYDKFHDEYEDLYRIRYKLYQNDEMTVDCAAAVPRVGPFMKEKMPEVIDYARAFPTGGIVKYEDKEFREESMHIVDPSFLKIFTFPLVEGDPNTALNEPDKVIITERIANKYFGNEDAIGKVLKRDGETDLEVTAVAKDVPNNSHIKFDFLISYESLNSRTRNEDGNISSETSWGWYDFNSYVLLQPGTDPADFDKRFDEALYAERGEDFEKYNFRAEFPLQAITDIHLYSDLLQESEPEEQGDGEAVFFLSIIAFFILLIAWINYINLSTARSLERAKEVGVRKTIGAYRKQLIAQFLTESFLLNFIAVIVGLSIVAVGIRYFNQLTDSQLDLSFLTDPIFWLVFIGIFLLGSIVAGAYPAFVLSSFRPVSAFKGSLSTKKLANQLRRVLVVFQFAASVALIAGTIIVYQQLSHMRDADLGFNMTETLVIQAPNVFAVDSLREPTLDAFKEKIASISQVKTVTSSSNIPGDEIFWTNGIRKGTDNDNDNKIIYIAGVDYNYFPSYGIKILAGRNYDKSFTTDNDGVMLNHAAVKYLGFESAEQAVTQEVRFWGEKRKIIGVVDDYHQMSVQAPVAPIVFPLVTNWADYFTLKITPETYKQTLASVEKEYASFFPGNPYEYFFLDKYYNRQYNNEHTVSRVFTLFAIFAIIVACMGLFGLSSFSALKRTKEIGIRKVFGAGVQNIIYLLSKEFIILVLVSNLIAWPLAWYLMNGWLENFATRIEIGWPVFAISGLLVVLITMLTVAYKTIAAARSNPVSALRYE
ncbi:MAG: ABC transporter permease [Bacteroidota bacterium]